MYRILQYTSLLLLLLSLFAPQARSTPEDIEALNAMWPQFVGAQALPQLSMEVGTEFTCNAIDYVDCDGSNHMVRLDVVPGAAFDLLGSFPTEIGFLTYLETLEISSATLQGSLPSEVGLLTRLQTLRIYGTQMSGQLPAQLSLLTALRTLTLARNRFSGELPDLATMTTLNHLLLHTNALTGSLPPTFHTSLGTCRVSNTGACDQALCTVDEENCFDCGSVPAESVCNQAGWQMCDVGGASAAPACLNNATSVSSNDTETAPTADCTTATCSECVEASNCEFCNAESGAFCVDSGVCSVLSGEVLTDVDQCCIDAPTADKCAFPNDFRISLTAIACAQVNSPPTTTAPSSTAAPTPCSEALEADGSTCTDALYTYACSQSCTACGMDGSKPCASVCVAIEAACVQAAAVPDCIDYVTCADGDEEQCTALLLDSSGSMSSSDSTSDDGVAGTTGTDSMVVASTAADGGNELPLLALIVGSFLACALCILLCSLLYVIARRRRLRRRRRLHGSARSAAQHPIVTTSMPARRRSRTSSLPTSVRTSIHGDLGTAGTNMRSAANGDTLAYHLKTTATATSTAPSAYLDIPDEPSAAAAVVASASSAPKRTRSRRRIERGASRRQMSQRRLGNANARGSYRDRDAHKSPGAAAAAAAAVVGPALPPQWAATESKRRSHRSQAAQEDGQRQAQNQFSQAFAAMQTSDMAALLADGRALQTADMAKMMSDGQALHTADMLQVINDGGAPPQTTDAVANFYASEASPQYALAEHRDVDPESRPLPPLVHTYGDIRLTDASSSIYEESGRSFRGNSMYGDLQLSGRI